MFLGSYIKKKNNQKTEEGNFSAKFFLQITIVKHNYTEVITGNEMTKLWKRSTKQSKPSYMNIMKNCFQSKKILEINKVITYGERSNAPKKIK